MFEVDLQWYVRQMSERSFSAGLDGPELIAVALILLCITVPWVRIFRKAGYNPGVGILMLIPPINIFLFLLFAYHEWPIERERIRVRRTRGARAGESA